MCMSYIHAWLQYSCFRVYTAFTCTLKNPRCYYIFLSCSIDLLCTNTPTHPCTWYKSQATGNFHFLSCSKLIFGHPMNWSTFSYRYTHSLYTVLTALLLLVVLFHWSLVLLGPLQSVEQLLDLVRYAPTTARCRGEFPTHYYLGRRGRGGLSQGGAGRVTGLGLGGCRRRGPSWWGGVGTLYTGGVGQYGVHVVWSRIYSAFSFESKFNHRVSSCT